MAKIKERADAPLEHKLSPTFYSLFLSLPSYHETTPFLLRNKLSIICTDRYCMCFCEEEK